MRMELPLVKWHPTGPESEWNWKTCDDFIFRYKKYCLRVEQMSRYYWWWAVFYEEPVKVLPSTTFLYDEIEFNDPFAKTCEEAMAYAEAVFYADLINKKDK